MGQGLAATGQTDGQPHTCRHDQNPSMAMREIKKIT